MTIVGITKEGWCYAPWKKPKGGAKTVRSPDAKQLFELADVAERNGHRAIRAMRVFAFEREGKSDKGARQDELVADIAVGMTLRFKIHDFMYEVKTGRDNVFPSGIEFIPEFSLVEIMILPGMACPACPRGPRLTALRYRNHRQRHEGLRALALDDPPAGAHAALVPPPARARAAPADVRRRGRPGHRAGGPRRADPGDDRDELRVLLRGREPQGVPVARGRDHVPADVPRRPRRRVAARGGRAHGGPAPLHQRGRGPGLRALPDGPRRLGRRALRVRRARPLLSGERRPLCRFEPARADPISRRRAALSFRACPG